MQTREFARILLSEKVGYTVLPTLNLGLLHLLVSMVVYAFFGGFVAAFYNILGAIFWYAQKEATKEAFKSWWWDGLPQIKFHGVFVLIEVGVLLALLYFGKLGAIIKAKIKANE